MKGIEPGTLVHHHTEALELDRARDYTKAHQRTDKPTGLWVSVTGEDDWESWCRGEDYCIEALSVTHVVTLIDAANILRITTAAELVAFDRDYGVPDPRMNDLLRPGHEWRFKVDWQRLYGEYDGIIIAPYQWSQRYEGPQWYWGWDCASGCIWNLNAIAAFEPVQVSA